MPGRPASDDDAARCVPRVCAKRTATPETHHWSFRAPGEGRTGRQEEKFREGCRVRGGPVRGEGDGPDRRPHHRRRRHDPVPAVRAPRSGRRRDAHRPRGDPARCSRPSAASTTRPRTPASGCSPAAWSPSSRRRPSTTTGADPIVTDGPFAESKEWLGGFWIFELPDLDAALKWAADGSKACQGQGRGPALPGRRVSDAHAAIERIYREEYGRVVASLVRRFGDIDIAEEAAGEALLVALETVAGRRRTAQPGRLADHDRGQPCHRPDPPRVAPRRQAPGGTDDRLTTHPTSRPASSRTTGCG